MHRRLRVYGIIIFVATVFHVTSLGTADESETPHQSDPSRTNVEAILSNIRENRSAENLDSVIPDKYSGFADRLFGKAVSASGPDIGYQYGTGNNSGYVESRLPNYEIKLQSRFFTPAEGVDGVLKARAEGGHVIIQFRDLPRDKNQFEAYGISLLSYLPHNSFSAYVPADAYTFLEENSAIRSVVPFEVEDKISLQIRESGVPSSLMNPDGSVRLIVLGFADENKDTVELILASYGAVTSVSKRKNMFALSMPEDQIAQLAAEDAIQWIESGPADNEAQMDAARVTIHADEVQAAPYNLDGSGVTLALWDGGWADRFHDDFAGRIVRGDAGSSTDSHATHVAGIMAGDGALSAGELRGLAGGADIRTYEWPDLNDVNTLDDETEDALDNDAMLSQNSWAMAVSAARGNCSQHGNYSAYSARYDEIISGVLGDEIVVVCAAANEENDGDCPPYPWDHLSPPMATAKNTICVGAVYSDTEEHTCFSSRGPTNDGRLKPDLCAPGDEANDDPDPCLTEDEIRSCIPGDAYGEKGGTSMAAPMVSGTIGLMREQFTALGYGEIDPHTYRTILAMTATDIGNPGPDYSNGHGLMNTQAAIDMIIDNYPNNELIRTDSVVDDEVISYYMSVPPGAGSLRVALGWDDEEGDPAAAVMLVNDLDLYLRSPSTISHYAFGLDPDNPNDNATTGWNPLDNLEVVQVDDPEPGVWEVRVWGWQIPAGNEEFTVVLPYEHIQCGDTIYHDTHLAEDLICSGDGLIIGADDITLYGHDFTISGDGGPSDYGVIFQNVANAAIQDCVINNFRNGIRVYNSDGCTIGAYNIISDCYTGIHYESSDSGIIGANTIYDNSDYGLKIINSNYNDIGIINDIYNSKRGIVFSGGSHGNSMLWNSVHDNSFYGVLSGGGGEYSNQIDGCAFFGNDYGIRYYNAGIGNHIDDCNIYENNYGLQAYGSSDFTIDDSDIYDNTEYGLRFDSNTSGIVVTNCTVCDNLTDIIDYASNSGNMNSCTVVSNWEDDGQGIGCDWQCDGCRQPEDGMEITENTTLCPGDYYIPDVDGQPGVVRVVASDVSVTATGVVITGDEDGTGYYTTQNGVSFIGGTAINYNHGFKLSVASACSLFTCTALTSDANGFFFSGTTNNRIYDCLARGNGSYGFSCGGGSGNEFTGCVSENNNVGFYFASSPSNLVYNSDISGNSQGLFVYNSNSNLFWFNRFTSNDTHAIETPAGILNFWNTDTGNLWDDFADNEGFPYTYVISGDGDGVDYHPIGAYITVKADGTGDYPTIQDAIDAAQNGNVIVLNDGVFTGYRNRDLNFYGKEIIVQSLSGDPETCIIDCEGSPTNLHRCVLFTTGEGPGTVLQGVTLTNTYVSYAYLGGTIVCNNSSPTINNCIISNGLALSGGGLYCVNSSPTVTDCTFINNSANFGGAVNMDIGGESTFDHVTFTSNHANDSGGALFIREDCVLNLNNCTLVDNDAPIAGAVYIDNPGNCYLNADNSIFYGNNNGAIYCSIPGHVELACCDLAGNVGGDYGTGIEAMEGVNGNISLVPLFCDPGNGIFTLRENSPCAPFSDPNPECDLIGAWPVGCEALSSVPDEPLAPVSVFLSPCRPNPSSAGTRISYGVSVREGNSPVSLKVYDPSGHLMRTLVDQTQRQGYYNVEWRGFDDSGKQVPGGVYFYQLIVDGNRLSKRVILLR
jgi:parallel beta-helix repeat protein/predicted outer membrane repeat protein